MTAKEKAHHIVHQQMYDNDAFSQWLGIEILKVDEGYSKLKMTIRKEMTNGMGAAHGGITFSFADSAFAFASNSHGLKSVSVETSISHTVALQSGDIIFAEAKLQHLSRKIGVYQVTVTKADDQVVALFKGTVYRTSKEWLPEN